MGTVHLERIDREAAGLEGFAAMGRRRDDDDRGVADLELTNAMRDGDARARPFLGGLVGDLLHLALGHLGIGLVFEMLDRMSARVIANPTDERDDAPGVRALDPARHLGFVEGLRRDRAAPRRGSAIPARHRRQERHLIAILEWIVELGDLQVHRSGEPFAELVDERAALGEPARKSPTRAPSSSSTERLASPIASRSDPNSLRVTRGWP